MPPPRKTGGAELGAREGSLSDIATAAMAVDRDIMVAARDGVRLATDVYRPEGGGAFPVILERTPYDKSVPSRSERTLADIAIGAAPRARAEVAAYFVSH